MNGLKEMIEYIVNLSTPNLFDLEDETGKKRTFADRKLYQVNASVPTKNARDYIELNTLTGLVEYIISGIDDIGRKMIVMVKSPTEVILASALDINREREKLAVVRAKVPDFRFDTYIDSETFLIGMQAKFIDTADKSIIMKFAGTTEEGTVATYGDDGVTQKATIKTGIASKSDAVVPNPVKLKPYRTFLEVDQPVSEFVFRMKSDRGVNLAIFEADGGAWQLEAKENVKRYLKEKLKEYPNYTVIS